MKSYTTKANANRAAKKINAEHAEIIREHDVMGSKEQGFINIFHLTCIESDIPEIIKENHQYTFPIQQTTDAIVTEVVEEAKVETSKRNKSEVAKPCNLTWGIADSMSGARRKDVIEACVKAGIAFYTARTQYQLWKQAQNA